MVLLPTATASPIPAGSILDLAAEGVHRPVDGTDGHGLKPRQAPGVLPHGADAADDIVAEDGLRVSDRGRSGDGALFEIAQVDRNGGRADVDGNAPGGVRRPGSGGRQREQRGQTLLNHLRREPALGGDLDGDRPVNHGAAGQAVPRRDKRIPQGTALRLVRRAQPPCVSRLHPDQAFAAPAPAAAVGAQQQAGRHHGLEQAYTFFGADGPIVNADFQHA